MRWNPDNVIKFITLYKSHACLWQNDTLDYKDKLKRKKAIEDIITKMRMSGFNEMECKIKIKNIRSNYYQELRKIDAATSKGEMFKPRLYWFSLMDSFLKPYIVSKKITTQTVIKVLLRK